MNRTELQALLSNGENSGVEWKRDDVAPEKLAKEFVALLNLKGGYVLFGVEDDGTVSGLSRPGDQVERLVMEAARTHPRTSADGPPSGRRFRGNRARSSASSACRPTRPTSPTR